MEIVTVQDELAGLRLIQGCISLLHFWEEFITHVCVTERHLRFFPAQNIQHILQICLHLEISFEEFKFLGIWVKSVGNGRKTPTNIEY